MPKRTKEEEDALRRFKKRKRYAKIKEDPEKYAIMKEKEKKRYQERKKRKQIKSIDDMTPREKREQRKKWRLNKSNERVKKKIKVLQPVHVAIDDSNNGSKSDEDLQDPLDAAACQKQPGPSKQSHTTIHCSNEIDSLKKLIASLKTKLIQRDRCIKKLKKKNAQQRAYISRIKKNEQKGIVDQRRLKIKKRNLINKDMMEKIQSFYQEDTNSRIASGKKEYITRRKIKKQKRYLLNTLRNLHRKFNETTEIRVSYAAFCKTRPFWVVFPKNNERDTCLCQKHVNMELLVKALRTEKIINERNPEELLTTLCCSPKTRECMLRTCERCKSKVINYNEFTNDKEISYYYWCKSKETVVTNESKVKLITTKKRTSAKPADVILKLESELVDFFRHCSTIEIQYKNLKHLKNNLSTNEVVIHMDWSENYNLKYFDEVQSLHFGGSRRQVSLHTAVIYMHENGKKLTQSLCTLSECTRHDASAVWAHLKPIFEFINSKNDTVDTLHFITDSPSSQYRNKTVFWLLTQLQSDFPGFLNKVTWNYCEAGHGKGAPDGVGAVLKRTADRVVNFGKDVGDFQAFLEIMKLNVSNIELFVVTENEIIAKDKLLPKKILTFKGSMKTHQVLWSIFSSENLMFRKYSCFICAPEVVCEHEAHLGCLKLPQITDPQIIALQNLRNSAENLPFYEQCPNILIDEAGANVNSALQNNSSLGSINVEDLLSPIDLDHSINFSDVDFEELLPPAVLNKENVKPSTLPDGIKVGNWVIVDYKSEKTEKYSIGQVLGIYNDNVSVSFVTRLASGNFIFPATKKDDVVSKRIIKKVVPNPAYNQSQLIFQNIKGFFI